MKKFILLFLSGITFYYTKAQSDKEQQQLKNIITQAYESVSQSTRQWFADAIEKHPAGDFDTGYAKTKLKGKLTQTQLTSVGDLWVCMLAYQKMLNKEARADRKLQSHLNKLMLASKAEKLRMDNETIDQRMKEAREKADKAMEAATTELVMGIASGSIQIAPSSFAGQGSQKATAKDTIKSKPGTTPASKNDKTGNKLSLPVYIRKLEAQLAILKKAEI